MHEEAARWWRKDVEEFETKVRQWIVSHGIIILSVFRYFEGWYVRTPTEECYDVLVSIDFCGRSWSDRCTKVL